MSNGTPTTRVHWAQQLLEWVDARFPLSALWKSQVSEYYAPNSHVSSRGLRYEPYNSARNMCR